MDTVLYAVVFVVGTAYVMRPVFRRGPRTAIRRGTDSGEWDALLAEKESACEAIADLDFEYETGKLSDGDYAEVRSRYRARALDVMERLASLEHDPGAAAGPGAGAAEADTRCPDCGKELRPSDRFCSVCGSSLVRDDRCSACRSPLDPDDRFCATCGHPRRSNDASAVHTSNRQEALT
jgi:Double zinc ribbon